MVHAVTIEREFGCGASEIASLIAHRLGWSLSDERLTQEIARLTGSTPQVPDAQLPTLEQRMDDVRAVMDAVGSERAIAFGVSEGGPMAALFSATYPDRTLGLIMYGSYAKRVWDAEYPWAPTPEEREKFFTAILEFILFPALKASGIFCSWLLNYRSRRSQRFQFRSCSDSGRTTRHFCGRYNSKSKRIAKLRRQRFICGTTVRISAFRSRGKSGDNVTH